ncbi:HNH endonuclease [Phyllobacterium sp. LjRoot231]|uniref:HNH endonuclease n=1 Tax=Phyllobacterium sp. LjRoot231 TaxID=3342289 RepID=UPI003ECF747F
MRYVDEWIGKSDDSVPTAACKRRILDRQDRKCATTGKTFVDGDKIEYDHVVPLWLGGANREDNLQAILFAAHQRKTAVEATVRSKINSQINKSFGLKKSSNPMPGSKASGWKKKMNGEVVPR